MLIEVETKTEKENKMINAEMELMDEKEKNKIETESKNLTTEIAAIPKITNRDSYLKACDLGSWNKRLLTQIENMRLFMVKPIKDHIKKIDGFFAAWRKPLEDNDAHLREMMARYQASVKTENIKTVHVPEAGRTTIQKRMTFEIIDANLVPKEWCKPDDQKIGRAVRGRLVTEIPGIKIWEENVTAFVTNMWE